MTTVYEQQEMGYRFKDEKKEHLHLLNGIPLTGTTTVLEVLGKNLTYWASQKALELQGFVNQKPYNKPKPSKEDIYAKAQEGLDMLKSMTIDQYVAYLDKAYRNHATSLKDSADKGTALHERAEQYVKFRMGLEPPPLFIDDQLKPFTEWCEKNVSQFLCSEACHYSQRLWVGGKSDFIYIDKQGKTVLADIKSAKEAYLSHFLQGGAYTTQIEENGLFTPDGKQGANSKLKIDRLAIFPFGGGFKEPVIRDDIQKFKDGFEFALGLYKTKQYFEGE